MTSSAVVGSSAMSSFGSAGQRHGDHDALLLPARELVRVGAGATGGQANLLEEFADPLSRRVGSDVVVQQDRFGQLGFDALDRVERVHRTLEHHSGLRPPDRAQLAERHPHDVLAVESDFDQSPSPSSEAGATPSSSMWFCRSRIHRRCRRFRPCSTVNDTLRTAGDRALPGLVGDTDVVELQQASLVGSARVEDVLECSPDEVEGQHDQHHADTGRTQIPPCARRDGPAGERVVEDRAP